MPFLLQLLISILGSAGALGFSIYNYILTRRREIAWKKTEFFYTQAQYLENNLDLIEAVKIIEGRHPDITISQIFDDNNFDKIKRNEYLQKIDKLLNFLRRLCYAHLETRIISIKEIEGFGWYFWQIAHSPSVVKYCDEHGFREINTVIIKLEHVTKVKMFAEPPPNKSVEPTTR